VAWSPDGTLIATAAHDKSVRLWNAADGKSVVVLDRLPDPALCVAFSLDGKLLAAGIMNGAIQVWDVARGTARHARASEARVVGLVRQRRCDAARLRSHDRTLKLWTFPPEGIVLQAHRGTGSSRRAARCGRWPFRRAAT